MDKICQTCKKKFIPKDDRPMRPAKFCSRKCIRNETQFKKGHTMRLGLKPSRYAWDNKNSQQTRFQKKHKVNNGRVPWNKNKDFGSTEYLAKRISWLAIYRKWKQQIKTRDNFKCIECKSSKELNVDHHPLSLAVLIRKYNIKTPQESKNHEELWDISNGRTLCVPCHRKTLTYGRNFVQKM